MRAMSKITAYVALVTALVTVSSAQAGEATAGKDGFKLIEGTDFTLEAHFLGQVSGSYSERTTRFQGDMYEWIHDRVELQNANDTREPYAGSFQLERVRTIFQGKAFKPWLNWKLEGEWTDRNHTAKLLDGYVRLGNETGFFGQIGQFRTPFDLFVQADHWRLHFLELPAASSMAPGYDVGWMGGWQSPEKRWLVRVASQNGAGEGTPDDNDGKLTTLRAEYQNKGGFGTDLTSATHPDETSYTVGVAWANNEVGGLIDEQTGGLCVIGSSRECSFETTSRTGLELFGALRTKSFSGAVSYQKWVEEDGRQVTTVRDGISFADAESTALSVDLGMFMINDKFEVVGRLGIIRDKDSFLSEPLLGPPGLGTTDPDLVPTGRPDEIENKFRTRQWGLGFNYYVQEHNLKLHFGWVQTETINEVFDRFKIYVPDRDLGTPPIRFQTDVAREGKTAQDTPTWYAVLSFYI